MKIEKITENKIRIILKQEELKDSSFDLHTMMTDALQPQGLFLKILDQAKKECGFETDGYKLLIEAFSSQDEMIVFTITKYAIKNEPTHAKRLTVRRKVNSLSNCGFLIYRFEDFEQYCSFCYSVKRHRNFTSKLTPSSLYEYQHHFFLVFNDISLEEKSLTLLRTLLSDFATFCTYTNSFAYRLKEYGKCIMKQNAIATTLKFFCKT